MKEYTNGGYVLIDCGGVNLLGGSTPQDKSGVKLWEQIDAAFKSGKTAVACNMVYGVGSPVTPVPVMIKEEGDSYCCTASILQVWVTKASSVTVVSLLGNNAKGGK